MAETKMLNGGALIVILDSIRSISSCPCLLPSFLVQLEGHRTEGPEHEPAIRPCEIKGRKLPYLIAVFLSLVTISYKEASYCNVFV